MKKTSYIALALFCLFLVSGTGVLSAVPGISDAKASDSGEKARKNAKKCSKCGLARGSPGCCKKEKKKE